MTKLENLIALRDAVKAGEHPDFCPIWHDDGYCVHASGALCGSLDAAIALHNAVLPGWEYGVTHNEDEPTPVAFVGEWGANGIGKEASSDTPARAWLLAILEALIAMEEGK